MFTSIARNNALTRPQEDHCVSVLPVPNLVSTIIPVYNRPTMLHNAVACLLAQTYRPIEIVIVDDGSTDSTPEVCQELAAAHPGLVLAVRQANAGPGAAREQGRGVARGEF